MAFAETTSAGGQCAGGSLSGLPRYLALSNIALKIFFRTDIWKRITIGGFREASHITRHITLSWDAASLLNLVIRRVLHNEPIRAFYDVAPDDVLADNKKQAALFIEFSQTKLTLVRVSLQHSTGCYREQQMALAQPHPELIHLLSCTRDVQLKKLELGLQEPQGDSLFERTAFKEALPEVSHVRYAQTLCAEYPEFAKLLEKLRGGKTQQTADTLASIWRVDKFEALTLAEKLADVAFFRAREWRGASLLGSIPLPRCVGLSARPSRLRQNRMDGYYGQDEAENRVRCITSLGISLTASDSVCATPSAPRPIESCTGPAILNPNAS